MSVVAEEIVGRMIPDWHKFIKTGSRINLRVRQPIVESWERCYKAKVDPYNSKKHRKLDPDTLSLVLKQSRELIDIAQPFMVNLYKVVEGSGFVVVLADARGYIMELFGDRDTLTNPITVNFFKGACWSEYEAGTNAVGTALEIKRPIQVSGAEHYCHKHHCLTCSAAPILDAKGDVLGILNVSGVSHAAHLHTLGMVVAAAEAIMAQIGIQKKNRELKLVNNRLTNIFNTMSDGVVVIDKDGGIIEFNPIAQKILGKFEPDVVGQPVDKVFGWKKALNKKMLQNHKPYTDVELMADAGQGLIHCFASGEPLTDEYGVVTGGVIILRTIAKIQSLVNRFSGHYGTLQFSNIIGNSKGMLEAIRVASLAAATSSNVLLQGESGTGKEIFAQAIHNRSDRRSGPFVAVNCGAIPRELIGSELFGYEEGAFTGARRGGKPGKFELAAGGTLLLDEIGDMPMEHQVALLRALQERKIFRVGGDKEIPVNVRVICATNKCLLTEVKKGTFRKDLYYRLNVISITIPPLRERRDDIPLLFHHFLEKMDTCNGRNFTIEPEVLNRIASYGWPGNVRELQNVIERIINLAEGNIVTLAHLPDEIRNYRPCTLGGESFSPQVQPQCFSNREERRRRLEENERWEIIARLTGYGGNVSLTARSMGLSRNTLYRKMRQYAIDN
ncbi:sigma-54-dependent Fis family transcriptional regulator [Sporomusa acidovorans]|uniref:Acetoin dehydrogenase operon transcriptional activator AcoR n=2 Tax=Sporomusa TaxID=2375 RepID=A0ABZ3IW27_SPOA4|nr:sigma-54-dependent Fis family transcriptional regulator [Sporomusa acidovorans]OZC17988.1 acetoin dehydrogenase operon transcriptional activator AcoR [Sporomusa acidovorans DSM 3132]SDF42175.1 PAS domain S-box-containing protein [Sporomusa acidovorans]